MSLMHVPIYVINMDDNEPRLRDVTNQLDQLQLKFERISAVAGRSLSKQQIEQCYDVVLNRKAHHRDLTLGEIGCYLSHRFIWQKMQDENINKALILEDDIAVQPRILDGISLAQKSSGWDVIKIADHEQVAPAQSKQVEDGFNLVSYNKVPNRTMGYFITKDAALKMLSKTKFYRPVDVDFQFYTDFDISICGLQPNCIEVSPEFGLAEQSDIAKQNSGEHNNHSTFWRNLKYRLSLYKRRQLESYQLDNFQF